MVANVICKNLLSGGKLLFAGIGLLFAELILLE